MWHFFKTKGCDLLSVTERDAMMSGVHILMQSFVYLSVVCIVRCSVLKDQTFPICFSHTDCVGPDDFCAWTNCTENDGQSYSCGRCRPCADCICDDYSIDFQCPSAKCPAQPINGVRFLQGEFVNYSVVVQMPNYTCFRRLVVSSSMFSFEQIAVFTSHPASMTGFTQPVLLSSLCPAFLQSGVLNISNRMDQSVLDVQAIVLSQGKIPF